MPEGKLETFYDLELEQTTEEWDERRSGIPTASAFDKLITPAKLDPSKQVGDYALELAAERWTGVPIDRWEGNYWTDRGHMLEAEARSYYEMRADVDVTLVGFVRATCDEWEAGCSPDGLVGNDGLYEAKCLGAKEHIRTLAEKEVPNKYRPQLQGQLLICQRAWVDIHFYHPHLPSRVFRVLPDPKVRTALEAQLKICQGLVNHYINVIEEAV